LGQVEKVRILAILAPAALVAAPPKEQPVGLMLNPAGAQLVRLGNETPMAAKVGEILFAGDRLKSAAGAASFLFCPEKSSVSLDPNSDATLDAATIKVKAGKVGDRKPIPTCVLPQAVRLSVASQQHFGVTMVRGDRGEDKAQGSYAERLQKLAPAVRAELEKEIEPIDKAIAADSTDQASRLSRAAVLEKHGMKVDALREYRSIAEQWKDAVWLKGKLFELEESIAADVPQEKLGQGGGKTLALLIGISKYQKLPNEQQLQYAHADAEVLHRHLRSPRGGGLPEADAILLVNEKATSAAIRNAAETFLKARATKDDTVILFFAAHGLVETAGSRGAYILTHDSDPQDLKGTALAMADVQNLLAERVSTVKRVIAFVDVCRSGTIGTIKSSTVNSSVEKLAESEGEIFGMTASRPKEFSIEGPEFGGGHGAFSHALIKGLGGAADKNGDKVVNVTELIDYVRDMVQTGTKDKQHPRDFGTMENTVPLADAAKEGIEISRWPVLYDSAYQPVLLAGPAQLSPPAPPPDQVVRFRESLAGACATESGRGESVRLLAALRPSLAPDALLAEENRLRVALEDCGQQVILRYLVGDQVPQSREDFSKGAAYYGAARALTPASLLLDARESFCLGRALLFEKKWAQGADLLERSAQLDSGGAHAFNALGIAYLEQAKFELAVPAFRDAIKRAPYWAYPRHNLALAYAETGDYSNAIRAYQDGMRLAPTYSYLPYNLGLLYQRLNRRKDAESAYRRAVQLAPDSPEGYNALGALEADKGRNAQAARLYRQALERKADFLPARHNLALVLSKDKAQSAEAVRLLEENLRADPTHLPSRLALAEIHAREGRNEEAATQYRAIVEAKPEFSAARVQYALLLLAQGRTDEAGGQLRDALKSQGGNSAAWEALGDVESKAGRGGEARKAYEEALRTAQDGSARKRIKGKVKGI
jgi:Tfp pilus assembly protein PilF